MTIRIIAQSWPGLWYARGYLQRRICEVIAKTNHSWEVLHPITKKSGYFVEFADAEILSSHHRELLPFRDI